MFTNETCDKQKKKIVNFPELLMIESYKSSLGNESKLGRSVNCYESLSCEYIEWNKVAGMKDINTVVTDKTHTHFNN